MALDKIIELNKFILSPEKKQRSITFKLNGFSLKTGPHHFQSFFISPSGYKISFFVYPNREGTHLSLFFEVLHGPCEDTLEWPLHSCQLLKINFRYTSNTAHFCKPHLKPRPNFKFHNNNIWISNFSLQIECFVCGFFAIFK